MNATRRRLLAASIGLAAPVIRPMDHRRASAAQRSLTFAGFGGLFQELYEAAIADPFSRAHPDAGVFWFPVTASTQTLATLRRQREQPELDVVLLDLASARAATSEGLLEPLTPAGAAGAGGPGAVGDVSRHRRTRRYTPSRWCCCSTPARCRRRGSGKSVWSVLDERSIAIPAPPESVGIAFTIVAGRLFGGGDEPHAAEAGVNAINDLAPRRSDLGSLARMSTMWWVRAIARFGVGWNMQAQVWSDRMSGRLGVAFPVEGTLSRVITVNLVKGAPRPEAGRQFISHMLGADAQKTMVERMYLGPVNALRAVLDPRALQRTANTPERVASAMPVDWVAGERRCERISSGGGARWFLAPVEFSRPG